MSRQVTKSFRYAILFAIGSLSHFSAPTHAQGIQYPCLKAAGEANLDRDIPNLLRIMRSLQNSANANPELKAAGLQRIAQSSLQAVMWADDLIALAVVAKPEFEEEMAKRAEAKIPIARSIIEGDIEQIYLRAADVRDTSSRPAINELKDILEAVKVRLAPCRRPG